MGQKTSGIRGIRASLAAAGSTVHPALVGSSLWFWALAAAMLFSAVGGRTLGGRS